MKILDYKGFQILGKWLNNLKTTLKNLVSDVNTLTIPFKNPDYTSSLALYGVDNTQYSVVIPIYDNCLYQIEGISYPGGGIYNPGIEAVVTRNKSFERFMDVIGISTNSSGKKILIIPTNGLQVYVRLLPVGPLVSSPYYSKDRIITGSGTSLETMCKQYGNGQYSTPEFLLESQA